MIVAEAIVQELIDTVLSTAASPSPDVPCAQNKQWCKQALMEGAAASAFPDREGAKDKAGGYALIYELFTLFDIAT